MPRPKRFAARVNLPLTQETYDIYAEVAALSGSTVPQLLREVAENGIPWLRQVLEVMRAAPQDPHAMGRLLLRRIEGVQVELGQLGGELESDLAKLEERQTKRKPA